MINTGAGKRTPLITARSINIIDGAVKNELKLTLLWFGEPGERKLRMMRPAG